MKLELILSIQELKELKEAVKDGIRYQKRLNSVCRSEKYKKYHLTKIAKYRSFNSKLTLAIKEYEKEDDKCSTQ